MNTHDLAMAAAAVIAAAACSLASLTAWLMVTSPAKVAFAFYDVKKHDWAVDAGDFNVYVGSSSARIELTDKITRQTP